MYSFCLFAHLQYIVSIFLYQKYIIQEYDVIQFIISKISMFGIRCYSIHCLIYSLHIFQNFRVDKFISIHSVKMIQMIPFWKRDLIRCIQIRQFGSKSHHVLKQISFYSIVDDYTFLRQFFLVLIFYIIFYLRHLQLVQQANHCHSNKAQPEL